MRRIAALLAACIGAVAACRGDAPRLTSCEPAAGIVPICGFSNPEDLVAVPGGDWLIVSQFHYRGGPAGSLVALRASDEERVHLYPKAAGGPPIAAEQPAPGWGDPSCPGPPDPSEFAPHGIDLSRRRFQPPALLVVNHGGREAVEMFEVGYAEGAPALWWRGCAVVPENTWPNDVASLPGGGFVVTKTMTSTSGSGRLWAGLRVALGLSTGHVLEWLPKRGWNVLAASEYGAPNGVAVSADGATIYFTSWSTDEIVRIARKGDPERRIAALGHSPDNISWSPDGLLLVTGQVNGLEHIRRCGENREGTCALPFSVVAIDPETLAAEVLVEADGSTAMGSATAAVQLGDHLYIGTFSGDRIAKVRRP